MRLNNVTFTNWLRSHGHKQPEERWLRELYPWPVLAQVDCDAAGIGRTQHILYSGVAYDVTLRSVLWQPQHGTFRYRVRVECEGLGWHARSLSDVYDLCGAPDGSFVTLFHSATEEPLERVARAFFQRRWADLDADSFRSLAVSRFLSACLVTEVAGRAFSGHELTHYPEARLVGDASPMLASGSDLWLGYRFFSEHAYEWARRCAGRAARVVGVYFADTTRQFKTALPPGVEATSIADLDAVSLGGQHRDLIEVLLRGLKLPEEGTDPARLAAVVSGKMQTPPVPVAEEDVHEALSAFTHPCSSKSELRYQLAAAVVLNAWIAAEVRLGITKRKRFYAFKQKVGVLATWASSAALPGVSVWAEPTADSSWPILYLRIDDVDFSFHAIPGARAFLNLAGPRPSWCGVRLKPIAPLVLEWARALRGRDRQPTEPQTAGPTPAPFP